MFVGFNPMQMRLYSYRAGYSKRHGKMPWGFITVAFLLLLILWSMSGCNTPNRARRAVTKWQALQPGVMAAHCSNVYPIREWETVREKITPGATVYVPGDTVVVDCDSVIKHHTEKREKYSQVFRKNIHTVRVPCPPSSTRVDTFTRDVERVQENTAAIAACKAEVTEWKDSATRYRNGRNNWRIVGLSTSLLIVAVVGLRFLKPKLF